MPWSADKAVQQFGRTHRSNQAVVPDYVLLMSKFAGEKRFASAVAKRIESLNALTHGERNSTESRDLSSFNLDNKYGNRAVNNVIRSIKSGENIDNVALPTYTTGNFYQDALHAIRDTDLDTPINAKTRWRLKKNFLIKCGVTPF